MEKHPEESKTSFSFPSLEEINQIGRYYSNRWGKSRIYANSIEMTYNWLKNQWNPLVLWKLLPITAFSEDGIILDQEVHLGNHFVSHFLENARSAMLGFASIGIGYDELTEEFSSKKQLLHKVIADIIGNILIGKLCSEFLSEFKKEQMAQGKFITNSIAPGESGWGLEDQAKFAQLLNWKQYGVQLSPYMVISPSKSETFLVGLASKPFPHPDDTRCNYCPRREDCKFYSHLLRPGHFCQ